MRVKCNLFRRERVVLARVTTAARAGGCCDEYRVARNAGVSGGFVGCIKSLSIFSANLSRAYNFTLDESSAHVRNYSDVGKSLLFSAPPFD